LVAWNITEMKMNKSLTSCETKRSGLQATLRCGTVSKETKQKHEGVNRIDNKVDIKE
jgi:hypothetical protein